MTLKPSFITVQTSQLKDQLNQMYDMMRAYGSSSRYFYELWELKELALSTAQETITVPANWLEEIERQSGNQRYH